MFLPHENTPTCQTVTSRGEVIRLDVCQGAGGIW